jgi:hypothetical protein
MARPGCRRTTGRKERQAMWNRFRAALRRLARFAFESDETYYATVGTYADTEEGR